MSPELVFVFGVMRSGSVAVLREMRLPRMVLELSFGIWHLALALAFALETDWQTSLISTHEELCPCVAVSSRSRMVDRRHSIAIHNLPRQNPCERQRNPTQLITPTNQETKFGRGFLKPRRLSKTFICGITWVLREEWQELPLLHRLTFSFARERESQRWLA